MLDSSEVFLRILLSLGAKNAPEAARKLGLSKQAVYDWQKNPPGLDNLIKIAESTNTSLHWLVTGNGERFVDALPQVSFEEMIESKIRQIVREEMRSGGPAIQDVGTVDEFLADSIRRHDDPGQVLKEWYRRQGWSLDELSVPDYFQNWGALTTAEKISEIKEFRDELVRHIERNEILNPKTS